MRVASQLKLTVEQKKILERLANSNTVSVRHARRAKILLLAAEGLQNTEIAAKLNVGRLQVSRWRERFINGGFEAIEKDLPRGGRTVRVDVQEIIRLTTQTTPENATHWSTRSLARATNVSDTTILRIWRANGLKPHLINSFKISNDPAFSENSKI